MYNASYHDQQSRSITVWGEGAVKVTPDTVHIIMMVNSRGNELNEIQQENADRMNNVISSLVAMGVPESSIQTIDYQIHPVYDYVDGVQIFKGYEVVNTIRVTISEISRVGEVVDTAVSNGVNQIGSIQFTIQDQSEYYQKALAQALQDAETKMVTIGSSLKLPNRPIPVKIEEQHVAQPVAFRAVTMAEVGGTPIESGTITVSASLKVRYQMV